jgi:nuclear transport factor 2 (NTF2) superfamily protein
MAEDAWNSRDPQRVALAFGRVVRPIGRETATKPGIKPSS